MTGCNVQRAPEVRYTEIHRTREVKPTTLFAVPLHLRQIRCCNSTVHGSCVVSSVCLTHTRARGGVASRKKKGEREREREKEQGRVAREPRRVRKTRGDLRSRGHTRTGADAHMYKGRRRDALAVILARRHPSRGTCRRSSSSSVTAGRHPRNRNSWEQTGEPLVRTRVSTPGTRQEAFRLLNSFEEIPRTLVSPAEPTCRKPRR